MSKKRIQGLDKYRLGKELADYKEHLAKKRGGGAGYIEPEPETVKAKKRGQYPCKKLKGEHDWVLQEKHKVACLDEDYNFYKCSACGKEHWQQKFYYECEECGAIDSWMYFFSGDSGRDRRKCKKCGSYKLKQLLKPIL